MLKNIKLDSPRGRDTTMDVGLLLGAIGISGSTVPIQSPFDRAASRYPNSNLTPYIQNAYVKVNQFLGYPWQLTLGRQPFELVGGLLASDNGVGFTGLRIDYPFRSWEMKTKLFMFEPSSTGGVNSLDLYGFSLEIPSEGIWELSALIEKDKTTTVALNTPVQGAVRTFYGLRYSLEYGPLSFDGQGVIQSGSAKPQNPAQSKITYAGTALLFKGKWTQEMGRLGIGQGRLSFGKGSGDHSDTLTRDEAFFPSYGKRFDGLERAGFGDFYGASLYDAFGSTSTANGLPPNASGVQVFNLGATFPPYNGIYLDIDYYIFQAGTIGSALTKSLGKEWDVRLHYTIKNKLTIQVAFASFSPGNPYNSTTAKRFLFEASGRF
ncbi:MAG: hypothetical protein HY399_07650 [Elusimicrobia bacterium]|nr:hypothetical protein [Elusimicrobiota bacterium]